MWAYLICPSHLSINIVRGGGDAGPDIYKYCHLQGDAWQYLPATVDCSPFMQSAAVRGDDADGRSARACAASSYHGWSLEHIKHVKSEEIRSGEKS